MGPTASPGCLSCAIASGKSETMGGEVFRTSLFNVSQDAEYMVPGFLIVASNRHFKSLDEMSDHEAREWTELIRSVRRAQREVLDIEHVYYFYNEDTRHHFHLWMLPRYEWMKNFGKSVESVRPALLHAKSVANAESVAQVISAVEKIRPAMRTLCGHLSHQ